MQAHDAQGYLRDADSELEPAQGTAARTGTDACYRQGYCPDCGTTSRLFPPCEKFLAEAWVYDRRTIACPDRSYQVGAQVEACRPRIGLVPADKVRLLRDTPTAQR